MGRSSVYNRLKLGNVEYLRSLGYTGGWGHFHIPDNLFDDMRDFLREIKHPYADLNRFGEGPNWRLRTARAALDAMGFRADLLKHGIQREVFMCELASNATKILKTGKGRPDISSLLSVEEVSELALQRWIIPRAARMPEYKAWQAEQTINFLGKKIDRVHQKIRKV